MTADPKHSPFIVPEEFRAFVEQSQRDFEDELKEQSERH